jgi:hypothetical protein
MKKRIMRAIAGSLCVLWLTGMAGAADYEAGWGRGLSESEVGARAFLKLAAERLCEPDDPDSEKIRKLTVISATIHDTMMHPSPAASPSLFTWEGPPVQVMPRRFPICLTAQA